MKKVVQKSLKMMVVAAGVIGVFIALPMARAEEESHSNEIHSEHEELRFADPLISESPFPEHLLRLDYFFRNINSSEDDADESRIRFVGEYAINRSISFQIEAPSTWREPADEPSDLNLDDIEFIAKYANFALEEKGIILGGGFRLGLPTGDTKEDIGSDHILKIEPFIDAGYKKGNFEAVSFISLGIPTNQRDEEENDGEVSLGYNLSFLYHVTPRIEALVEFDGSTVLSGDEDGHWIVNITSGIKVRPFKDVDFDLGVGVSLPLTDTREFDVRAIISAFFEF